MPVLLPVTAFFLQIITFSKWAMLGSNQRPPPCKRSVTGFQRLLELIKCLQIGIFSLRGFHGCSLLFTWVGVKMVSTGVALSVPRRTPSSPMFSCSSSNNIRSRRADSSLDEVGRCLNRSRTTRTHGCSLQLPSGPRASRRWADPTHHLGQSVG